MYKVTQNFRNLAKSVKRHESVKAVFDSFVLTGKDIISMSYEGQISDGQNIALGGAYTQKIELTAITNKIAFGQQFKVYGSYDGAEWCPLGTFCVTEITKNEDDVLNIVAYDKMAALEGLYNPAVAGRQMKDIVDDIAKQHLFDVEPVTYPVFEDLSIPEEATCRQMIGYIAGILGKNAIFNRDGKLEFRWYKEHTRLYGDANGDGKIDNADIDYINANWMYSVTDKFKGSILGKLIVGLGILGASYNQESFIADVNGDGIVNQSDINCIDNYINGVPGTGVAGNNYYYQELKEKDYIDGGFTKTATASYTIGKLISGTDEEPLEVGNGRAISFSNPYMTSGRLLSIKAEINNFSYDPGSVNILPDISWELGDIVRVYEKGKIYVLPIMKQTFAYQDGLEGEITSFGQSEESIKAGTKTRSERSIEREIAAKSEEQNERLKAQEEQVEKIKNNITGANGGYFEILSDVDGRPYGTAWWKDQAKLSGWKFTYGGLGYFANGQLLHNAVAFDKDGNLNADYITAGTISANKIFGGTLDCSFVDVKNLEFKKLSGGANLQDSQGAFLTVDGGRAAIGTPLANVSVEGRSISISGIGLGIDSQNVEITGRLSTRQGVFAQIGNSSNPQRVYLDPGSASTDQVYRSTNSGILGTSSSLRRLKNSIEDLKPEIVDVHELYKLPVRQFKWNKGEMIEADPETYNIGFIAEEVEEHFPKGAIYRNGELASWGERNFIPAMLKLIQEQHKKINELENKLAELERRVP